MTRIISSSDQATEILVEQNIDGSGDTGLTIKIGPQDYAVVYLSEVARRELARALMEGMKP